VTIWESRLLYVFAFLRLLTRVGSVGQNAILVSQRVDLRMLFNWWYGCGCAMTLDHTSRIQGWNMALPIRLFLRLLANIQPILIMPTVYIYTDGLVARVDIATFVTIDGVFYASEVMDELDHLRQYGRTFLKNCRSP
jgi:hypothetical protein